MTDVIQVSSADLTSATIVTLKISIIIHATANGALHPGPFADCVTENSLEKTATHII